MIKTNYPKRVIFVKGRQQEFVTEAQRQLGLSNFELAAMLGVHDRTFRDWKREKYSISLEAVNKLVTELDVNFPTDVKVQEPFWYASKGAKIGGRLGAEACYKKYGYYGGDPEYRKRKWREWWEKEGKYTSDLCKPLAINLPNKSIKLSEYVGLMMGDGGISPSQLTVTLHHEDDKEYIEYVVNLIKQLFHIEPSILHCPEVSVKKMVISRVKLVDFCVNVLGLKKGNKILQKLDIPDWIKGNSEYEIACIRGLVDTDGSIFTHTYKVGSKYYSYKKLCFCSASPRLIHSFYDILHGLGLKPRLAKKAGKLREVRLDSKKDMAKYFGVIGSHNPKHLRKFQS